jgi:hypothetical protein
VLNSTNADHERSCCLSLSATAPPRLPPSVKPLRNGKPWVHRHQCAEACLRLASRLPGMVRTRAFHRESGLLGERVFDHVINLHAVTLDALGIDLEQHVYRVTGALSDLGRRDASVEPQRHRSVA